MKRCETCELRPMHDAPQDRTPILARTLPRPESDRFHHYGDRWFVVSHLGRSSRMDLDMGWSLFPGFGVDDGWFAGWLPLPTPPKETNDGNSNVD